LWFGLEACLFLIQKYVTNLSIRVNFKKKSPRARFQFKKEIRPAFAKVVGKDLISWFKHLGYNISINYEIAIIARIG